MGGKTNVAHEAQYAYLPFAKDRLELVASETPVGIWKWVAVALVVISLAFGFLTFE